MVGEYVSCRSHPSFMYGRKNEEIRIEQWIVFLRSGNSGVDAAATALRFQIARFPSSVCGAIKIIIKNGYVRANPVRAGSVNRRERVELSGGIELPAFGSHSPARQSLAPPVNVEQSGYTAYFSNRMIKTPLRRSQIHPLNRVHDFRAGEDLSGAFQPK